MDYKGDRFTWNIRQENDTFTKEKLDRGIAIQACSQLYTNYWVESMVPHNSNHKPIVLTYFKRREENERRKEKEIVPIQGWLGC